MHGIINTPEKQSKREKHTASFFKLLACLAETYSKMLNVYKISSLDVTETALLYLWCASNTGKALCAVVEL